MTERGLLIGGAWRAAADGGSREVRDPATGELVGRSAIAAAVSLAAVGRAVRARDPEPVCISTGLRDNAHSVSVAKCEICRSYYQELDGHRCPGLRSVDWVRFMRSLREWMASDPHARFEIFYARRRRDR